MASQAMPIAALVGYIRDIADATGRATGKAMLEATEMAYAGAVANARNLFGRTPGRTRSGQLMNAIYRGYDPKELKGFVGVRLAYGAIQEFGGPVEPKSAKHLWVKNFEGVPGQFKRWQPRDFMAARQADPKSFAIFRSPHSGKLIAAYRASGGSPAQTIALFALVDRVVIPPTPYVTPAVEAAYARLAELVEKHLSEAT